MKRNSLDNQNEDVKSIFTELGLEKITSWYEFEMRLNILGFEVNEEILNIVIEYCDYSSIYKVLYDTIVNYSVLDDYFMNFDIISKFINRDGREIFLMYYGQSIDFETREKKFEGCRMLKELDMRNPKYLLKYFLHCESFTSNDKYFDLFYDIIERTKLRAKKMKVFEKYIDILEEKFKERKNIQLFSR